MCFLTKCPYVPPHEFNLDFPHLMLRYRAMEERQGKVAFADKQLAATDRNGKLAGMVSTVANWATRRDNKTVGPILRSTAGLHPDAELPKYASQPLVNQAAATPVLNREAPAFGRKAVLYATCFGNYNSPDVGLDTRAVLARNGVETEVAYPALLRHADAGTGPSGRRRPQCTRPSPQSMKDWIARGYDVIALVPSCALMLKFEWPLILPDDPDVAALAKSTFDISEYIVDIAKKEGIAPGLAPTPATMTLHMACHARAQNMGQKAAEMLRLVPQATVKVIERCSGHGGSWGFKQEHFEVGMKVGRPVVRQAAQNGAGFVMSECPLAGVHIQQGIERLGGDAEKPTLVTHPIQILARAYEGAA